MNRIIKTRSPHYISTTIQKGEEINLKISRKSKEVNLSKIGIEDNHEVNFNISNILKDFIIPINLDLKQGTQVQNFLQGKFVSLILTSSVNGSISTQVGIPLNGYLNGLEEQSNLDSSSVDFLVSGNEYTVNRNSIIVLPIYKTFHAAGININSFPNGDMTLNLPFGVLPSLSYAIIKVSDIITDDYIIVESDGKEVIYYIEDDYIYKPLDVVFENKQGALQSLCFKKERKNTLTTTGDLYNKGNSSRQFQPFNVNGSETISVNSGYVNEDVNESYKELFLSENIYIIENEVLVPVNIESKSFLEKTQNNDNLIDYDVTFKRAYDIVKSF